MTVAGSGPCYLTQPDYTARLSYIGGGDVEIDAVVSQDFVNAKRRTWGEIKSIYR